MVLFTAGHTIKPRLQRFWKWFQYASPEEAGFSAEKLEKAREYFNTIDAAAVMVIYRGVVLAAWGDIERRYWCHSVRKSFMNALYGIYVEKGLIDLSKTLKELNIDGLVLTMPLINRI